DTAIRKVGFPPQTSRKMSSSWSFVAPTLQFSFLLPRPQLSPSLHQSLKWNRLSIRKNKVTLFFCPTVRYLTLLFTSFVFAQLQAPRCVSPKPQSSQLDKFTLLLQYGAILAAVSPTSLGVLLLLPPVHLLLMLWAPFLNFRKFPRDPTMEYPWSTPKDDVPLYKSR
ncbi:hypothetical protein GW17_00018399, partial [Ensete ventricosum]